MLCLLYYVKNPFTKDAYFDFEEFAQHAQVAQRLMDDLVDLEEEAIQGIINKVKNDPEDDDVKFRELNLWKKIFITCKKGRRTGTGITALGDALAALGLKYGSRKSIEMTDKIYKALKLSCYRSSVDMSKALGAFPIWDHELEKDNPFLLRIKDEDPKLWKDMKQYGRRNIALLTTAPAGSVSILTQTTSGIEPQYSLNFTRRKKINPNDPGSRTDFIDGSGDHWQEYKVYPKRIKEWMRISGETDESKSPWSGACAIDLDWVQRVKLQATAQKHIDHSISSTVNLPNDVTVEKVAEIYEAAWKSGCKGLTVYRNGCRSGVLINEKPNERNGSIQKTQAPKRPKELICDIYHVSVKGEAYLVVIGLFKNEPYEIFAGKNGQIPKTIKQGIIKKVKRGKYQIIFGNNKTIDSIIDLETSEEEAMTRMISTALRHGADISFIVHQLEKTKGDLTSFSKSVARTLKKYIQDGTNVTGEECENCGGKLMRQDGCITCPGCGWSRCS